MKMLLMLWYRIDEAAMADSDIAMASLYLSHFVLDSLVLGTRLLVGQLLPWQRMLKAPMGAGQMVVGRLRTVLQKKMWCYQVECRYDFL